ncbi:hypothetical protein PICSAR200_02964 [Mycobacterium avium subsp. paratuberculosis]|nr:hypothetical protein PICSAR200_02964 [Mycobacterium avium subsp. paratuberculosis]
MKPHTSISLSRNAGPAHRRPKSPRYTISRLAGLMKARNGTRATSAVSASLTTATGPGSGEYASTGTTWNCEGAMNIFSIVASGCSRLTSIPVSSRASRRAVATGPSSVGSAAPPGNAACPAWWRSVDARTVTSRSASVGGPPPGGPDSGPENSTSTAASRAAPRTLVSADAALVVIIASTSAGNRRRAASGTWSTLSTSGRSQDGQASGVSGTVPRAGAGSPFRRGEPPALTAPPVGSIFPLIPCRSRSRPRSRRPC